MNAEECIKAGDLEAALSALQNAVRDNPAKPEYRTFLFQLLCVMGNWNRALTQLNVVGDMDNGALLMAQTYRELLLCEAFREEVFQGKRAPLLFGEPNSWLGTLIQALGEAHKGNGAAASEIVMGAMEKATAREGMIDDQAFEWLSDADMRLGPVFEIILNGKYYWVPMDSVEEISFSEPEDLRDLVWLPVQIRWVNEGSSIGFMPARYPGNATLADPQNALARKTDWIDTGGDFYTGAGQRMFTTDSGEYSLLQTRRIVFQTGSEPVESGSDAA
ncbi:MAG: tetratricopeptide repeat protein [Granulosicoccus sp.]|nr:tetratricopeptide repeat protein [Granulosicoccus sp.]